jgi:protein SCO1/2
MVGLALALGASTAEAATTPPERLDRTEQLPKRLEGIDVEEKLDTMLPLGLPFVDENGRSVRLGNYFDDQRPVVITLNYSNCPMLCSLQLTGFVEGLKKLDWTAGMEFRVVTVSLDPSEAPAHAHKTKSRYLRQYGRPEAGSGWHFLTGSEQNIRALANAIGFRYGYNEKRAEYVHPAAITLATPRGKIARYLYGLEYPDKTLRLGLVEASEGKVGSTVDRLILYCFHYDSSEGRYAPVARNIMRLGGAITVVLLGSMLFVFWRAELRRKRSAEGKTT